MKTKKKSRFRMPLILLFLAYVLYFGYTYSWQQRIIFLKTNEDERILAKIDDAYAQQEELQQQKDMGLSDEAIEKVAREKLGMVKSGERVFYDINK